MDKFEAQSELRNNDPKYIKKRKIIIFGGLGLLVVLIVLAAILFTQPKVVTFSTGLGSKIDGITVNDEGFIEVPADPTRYGWDFAGWYQNSSLTVKIDDLSTYTFNKSTTIYAKWTLHRYKVIYELNGGTLTSDAPTEYVIKHQEPEDETWTYDFDLQNGILVPNQNKMLSNRKLSNPTKKDFTFDGWYDNPEFTGNRIVELDATNPIDNLKLYAKWIA